MCMCVCVRVNVNLSVTVLSRSWLYIVVWRMVIDYILKELEVNIYFVKTIWYFYINDYEYLIKSTPMLRKVLQIK